MPDPGQLAQLPQFRNLSPEARKQALELFQSLSYDEQEAVLRAATPAPAKRGLFSLPPPEEYPPAQAIERLKQARQQPFLSVLLSNFTTPGQGAPGTAAGLIQGGLQTGGALLGRQFAGPIGGAVGEAGGSLAGLKIGQALGLQPGPVMSWGAPESLAVGLPLGLRTLGGLFKMGGSPAVRATEEAQEATAKQAAPIHQKNIEKITEYRAEQASLPDRLAEWSARNKQEYLIAKSDYEEKVRRAMEAADLTNQERLAKAQQAATEYQARLAKHEASAKGLPKLTQGAMPTMPSKQLYAAIDPVTEAPIPAAREEAKKVLEDIEQHLPNFQNSQLASIARNLQEFPEGGEANFGQFQKLLSDVGNLKGTMEARDSRYRGLAKQLYGALRADFDKMAGTTSGENATLLKQANAAFRREQAIEDFQDILRTNITQRPQDNAIEVNARGIRRAFQKLEQDDQFFKGSLTQAEHDNLRDAVQKLTTLPRVGNKPPAAQLKKPNLPEPLRVAKINPNVPQEPIPPAMAPVPAAVEPSLGSRGAMFATIRHGAVGGGLLGSAIGAASGTPAGWGMGALAGGVAATVPLILSSYLLHGGPVAKTLLSKLVNGQQLLSPQALAILQQVGTRAGIIPQEQAGER